MQYAQRQIALPDTRKLLVPVLALAFGAAGATGAYALLDNDGSSVTQGETKVIVADPPAQPSQGVAAKNEAGVASAIATRPQAGEGTLAKDEAGVAALMGSPKWGSSTETKDEAATAAAINPQTQSSSTETKDEAATASVINTPQTPSGTETKDEAATASVIAPSKGSISQEEANRTDPHGPAAALP